MPLINVINVAIISGFILLLVFNIFLIKYLRSNIIIYNDVLFECYSYYAIIVKVKCIY